MQKLVFISSTILSLFFFSCGSSTNEIEQEKQALINAVKDSLEQVYQAKEVAQEQEKQELKKQILPQNESAVKGRLLAKEVKERLNYVKITQYEPYQNRISKKGVVEGTIYNSAVLATYKDPKIKVSCYSKTGTLLNTFSKTFYEYIKPQSKMTFKHKFKLPKGTDKIDIKIEDINVG